MTIKKLLFILIIYIISINLVYGNIESMFPSTNDISSFGLKNVKITKDYSFKDIVYQKIFAGGADGLDRPYFNINIKISKANTGSSISLLKKSLTGNGYSCTTSTDTITCTKEESINSKEYKYNGLYKYVKILDYDSCDESSCYKNSITDHMTIIDLTVGEAYNFTRLYNSIGNNIANFIVSHISQSNKPTVTIIEPKNSILYYKRGKPFTFNIKVNIKGSGITYAGAHYEANGVMIGGGFKNVENGGLFTKQITLEPDEIFENATIKAYAKTSEGDTTKTLHITLKPAKEDKNEEGQDKNKENHYKKEDKKNNKNKGDNKKNKINGNKIHNEAIKKVMSKYNNEISIYKKYSNEKADEIESTKARLSKLKAKEIRYGNTIKLIQDDKDVKAKKGSYSWFKLKYSLNKHVLDRIIDNVADKLPMIGLFKDYFKSDKDTNLFDDDAKKTASDLSIDMESAKLYSTLSGIEDREKSLSPAKNIINTPVVSKPMEFAIDAMTMGTKRIIAKYYKKEYNYIIGLAKDYRKSGMKWRDIHSAIKTILDENEGGIRGLSSAKENAASQYLNTMSKGEYKDIRARADLYISQAIENGDLR